MDKRTLKFQCLINMAMFSRQIRSGYLMNTNNLTLTGRFSDEEIQIAVTRFEAEVIETTEKVFSYHML
ncbi:MAG TPA: hypothetical protein VFZ78_07010 [Flavisolibacter sp.]